VRPAVAQSVPPAVAGDFVAATPIATGETLTALNLHYRTLARRGRDAAGVVRNAVLILHGTAAPGEAFLSARSAASSRTGAVLDATRYFIILPDGIGHGKSTKPSDGLRTRFPKYTYDEWSGRSTRSSSTACR